MPKEAYVPIEMLSKMFGTVAARLMAVLAAVTLAGAAMGTTTLRQGAPGPR
jgi:hypothetical protein